MLPQIDDRAKKGVFSKKLARGSVLREIKKQHGNAAYGLIMMMVFFVMAYGYIINLMNIYHQGFSLEMLSLEFAAQCMGVLFFPLGCIMGLVC